MDTKEKNKKEYDDIFVISMIMFINIFYALPIAIQSVNLMPFRNVIYMLFPALIACISTVYGYKAGKDYKLPILMYLLLMPGLVIITASDHFKYYTHFFIIAFFYFVISLVALNFGNYVRNEEEKAKNKKNKSKKKTIKETTKKMAKEEKVKKTNKKEVKK